MESEMIVIKRKFLMTWIIFRSADFIHYFWDEELCNWEQIRYILQ